MSAGKQRLVMPPAAECLADLRRWARSWMEQHPVPGIDLDSVLLSMTELVTNSIKHGSGPVDVELATDEESLLLGVSDCSDELPSQFVAAPDAEGGRGIVVLDGLATRWGVRPRIAGGKTVWCEFASR
jgi:anti-sigma regulatory factor (Ser/Thr protein kinase)